MGDQSTNQFLLELMRVLNRSLHVPWNEVMGLLGSRFPNTRFFAAQARQGSGGRILGWEGWDSVVHDPRESGFAGKVYDDRFASIDPVLKASAAGPGVFRIEKIGTPEEFSSAEVQRTLLGPAGFRHGIVCYLGKEDQICGILQCWRRENAGAWSDEEISDWNLYAPPISDAVHRDHRRRAAMNDQLAEVLDALNEGAICVDAQGVILHSNAKAPATVVRDVQGSTATPRLPEEIQAEVASIRDGVARLDLRLSQDRINCVVRRLSGGRAGQRSAAVVLFPDADAGDRIGQIRARYQLTPREGDVLACVIRGRRNADIAQDLQLSEYTVKGHLKRIFQKLGVRSRTHAVAKVMEHGDLGAETV